MAVWLVHEIRHCGACFECVLQRFTRKLVSNFSSGICKGLIADQQVQNNICKSLITDQQCSIVLKGICKGLIEYTVKQYSILLKGICKRPIADQQFVNNKIIKSKRTNK